jgi:thioesterase domain-containing protein
MINELIQELNCKGIQLSFSNGKLKYSGPEQHITPEIIQKLKDNKESLKRYLWPVENSNLIPINLKGTKTPFILVHGSNSVNFLSKYFDAERPVLNYLDLGSNGERIPSKSIDEMANNYINQLIELVPNGPYIFCGFSFGGLLAFKMAEILQEKGISVPCLILFDTKTPQAKVLSKVYNLVHNVEENKIKFLIKAFIKRIKMIRFIMALLFHRKKPIPVDCRNRYIMSIYHTLMMKYTPTKINSDILLFRSKKNLTIDPQLGWGNLVNKIDIVELEGDHLGIIYLEQNYQIISERIGLLLKSKNI